MTRSWVETLLSLGVLTVAIAFVAYAMVTGDATPTGSYKIKAKFTAIDGIDVGDPVLMAGLQVGTVSSLALDTDNFLVEVTMDVQRGLEMFTDSFAAVQTTGIFGSKFILLDPGGGEDTMLKPGDTISYIQDSLILDELVEKIVRFAKGERERFCAEPKEDEEVAAVSCPN